MGKTIRAQCDNMAVVAMVNTHSQRESEAMHLMRCLAFLETKHSFYIIASHIPGAKKVLADALSRDNQVLIHSLYPQAHKEPATIPASLLDVLIITKPDWTSHQDTAGRTYAAAREDTCISVICTASTQFQNLNMY